MKKIFISAAIVLALGLESSAQTYTSGFFLDNYLYGYRFNAALQGERDFFAIGLGNINAELGSSNGVGSYLFPYNGKLVTGFNSNISSEKFLAGIAKNSTLDLGLDVNLLSFGLWGKKKTFSTVEINVRGNAQTVLPKDLFALLKNGSSGTAYDISNTSLTGNFIAEVAYGWSREFSEKLTVGARIKALVGMADAELELDKSSITINGSQISYELNGNATIAANLLKIGVKQSAYNPSKQNVLDFTKLGFNAGNYAPSGFGAAVDLGATYRPVKGLAITAGVNDLGFLKWKNNITGVSSGKSTFSGLTIDPNNLTSNSEIGGELQEALDKLMALADFESKGVTSSTSMLSAIANVGARYSLPFYNRLSVGCLLTHRFNKLQPWTDFKGGVTITPVNFLSLSGNIGTGSYGPTFGLAASLTVVGINIFAGFDGYMGKVGTLQVSNLPKVNSVSLPIPLHAFRYSANLGIAISFSPWHKIHGHTSYMTIDKKPKED